MSRSRGDLNRVRSAVRRIGLPGVLALLLLVLSAGLVFVVQPRQRAALDAAQASAEAARSQALERSRAASITAERALRPAASRWLQHLPDLTQRQPRVAALLERAAQHNLVVKRSEFRFVSAASSAGVSRYRVNVPVLCSYGNLRSFLQDALQSDAALVLDSVRLRRSQVQAPLVQAELQFTLLMRETLPIASNPQPAAMAIRR